MKWSSKAFSVAIGRGLFTFDSSNIVVTDTFHIESLPISAKILPLNISVELTVSQSFLNWPEFHVGAATGLQIRKDCKDLDSSWIVFNQKKTDDGKPDVDAKHGGFLLGLGLNGHLKNIELADSLRYYLLPQHEMVSIGLILGLGISFIGTRSVPITQMVSVHIASHLPKNSSTLNTAVSISTAAIVAYGIIYLESNGRFQTDKVFGEIAHATHIDLQSKNADYECFIIGCGFALV